MHACMHGYIAKRGGQRRRADMLLYDACSYIPTITYPYKRQHRQGCGVTNSSMRQGVGHNSITHIRTFVLLLLVFGA